MQTYTKYVTVERNINLSYKTIDEVIKLFKDIKEKIPEKYREKAEVNVDLYEDYTFPSCDISVEYVRNLTEEEINLCRQEEIKDKEKRMKWLEKELKKLEK